MPPRPEPADARTPESARVGRRIDHYQLIALIGRGTTGAVYRARDVRLGRTVVIKTATGTRDGARLTDRVRQRFLREAMALSKIDHRNVVRVIDFGFADDGTPFVVMEHLRGQDLAAVLAAAAGPLLVADVADIGLGVCAALRACHRAGIIHRDLKPGNVFLAQIDTGTEIKVLDFGVCRAASADDRTRAAPLAAPSHHLAPEQIDGKVGPASDQYALGVLLHLCLTRRLPRHPTLRDGRDQADALPAGLSAVLSRATSVAPADRYESVYALGRELLPFASQRGQVRWQGYYELRSDGLQGPSEMAWTAPQPPRPAAGQAAPTPTAVEVPGDTTKTNASRRAARSREPPRPGAWPWRAASIGCVALAATEIGSATRSPPRSVPPPAARRTVVGEQTPSPQGAPPAPRPSPPPSAAAPPLPARREDAPAPASPGSTGRRLPPRRSPAPAAPAPPNVTTDVSPTDIPTIDPAGVGIPSE